MLAYVHDIVSIAIVQHAAGYGGGRMLAIGEDADLLSPFNQRPIEGRPWPPGERHDAHVVIGHQQPMGQHLQRVERRVEHHLGLGHLAPNGVGETKEKRIAAGKDNHVGTDVTILPEHRVKGHGDVDPPRIGRQQ